MTMTDDMLLLTIMVTVTLAVQVLTLMLTSWSIANAITYVSLVQKHEIKNGKRVAAKAILWRAVSLAFAVIAMGTASVIILLSIQEVHSSVDLLRATTLWVTSIALAFMSAADVYERVALGHLNKNLLKPEEDLNE